MVPSLFFFFASVIKYFTHNCWLVFGLSSSNAAVFEGGVLNVKKSQFELIDSVVKYNSAGEQGGSFFVDSDALLVLHRTQVAENTVEGRGAAFYLSLRSRAFIYNSVVVANKAQEAGGPHSSPSFSSRRYFDGFLFIQK